MLEAGWTASSRFSVGAIVCADFRGSETSKSSSRTARSASPALASATSARREPKGVKARTAATTVDVRKRLKGVGEFTRLERLAPKCDTIRGGDVGVKNMLRTGHYAGRGVRRQEFFGLNTEYRIQNRDTEVRRSRQSVGILCAGSRPRFTMRCALRAISSSFLRPFLCFFAGKSNWAVQSRGWFLGSLVFNHLNISSTSKFMEQISWLPVGRRMLTLPQALDKIVATVNQLSSENRRLLVRTDLLPAMRALRLSATKGSSPPLVTKSLATMESWANYIATNPTSWRMYAERLGTHSRSLRILAKVQTMGGVAAEKSQETAGSSRA
jgi:hypothetical protein